MSARVDATGLSRLAQGVRRASSGALQKELVATLQDAGPKMVTEMRGSASTRIQNRAASSITMRRTSDGIELAGGQGGGLGATLFDGGEYGGRKSRKVIYATRSPLGKPYVVRRRTTMQFLPHLGREGYFFWQTVRDWMPKLEDASSEIVEKTLGGR